MEEEWTELEWKEKICQDVHISLCRLCGGVERLNNIAAKHHGSNDEQQLSQQRLVLWHKELKELADKSVSFPNGGRIHCSSDNIQRKKNGGGGGNKPHNIEIRAALSYFHRYRPKPRRKKRSLDGFNEQATNENGDEPVSLKIVSDLGLVRNIDSAIALAILLCLDMEEQQQQQQQQNNYSLKNVYDVRACPKSGMICGITRKRSIYLRTVLKKLPCPYCVTWTNDLKGLWWHQQLKHGINHSQAVHSATMEKDNINISHSLVLYQPQSQISSETRTAKITKTIEENNYYEAKTSSEQKNLSLFDTPSIINNNAKEFGEKNDFEVEIKDPVNFVKLGNLSRLMEIGATKEGRMNIINYIDKNGATSLHWAAGLGHLDIVKYIIEVCCGTDNDFDIVNQKQKGKRSFQFRTPLHWAARNGHLSVVEYLCDQTSIQINATTADGTTSFCWASWQGHYQIMHFLYFKGGCNPHLQNEFGCNAVLWAAQGDNETDIIKWLLSIQCDIYKINTNGHGILHKSAQRGHLNTCQWLFQDVIIPSLNSELDEENYQIITKYIQVVSPDAENYCPSDLAGMEGYETLALWLSQHECELIYRVFKNNIDHTLKKCAITTMIPSWLYNEIIDVQKNVSIVYSGNLKVWENGGGKRRMASYMVRHTLEK